MNTWDSLSRQIKDKDTGEVISNDTRPIRDVYAQAMMAPQYADLTFPVPAGQHCIYEGKLYVAAQGIQTSEVWTAAHWTEVKLGAELANLKSHTQKTSLCFSDTDAATYETAPSSTVSKAHVYNFVAGKTYHAVLTVNKASFKTASDVLRVQQSSRTDTNTTGLIVGPFVFRISNTTLNPIVNGAVYETDFVALDGCVNLLARYSFAAGEQDIDLDVSITEYIDGELEAVKGDVDSLIETPVGNMEINQVISENTHFRLSSLLCNNGMGGKYVFTMNFIAVAENSHIAFRVYTGSTGIKNLPDYYNINSGDVIVYELPESEINDNATTVGFVFFANGNEAQHFTVNAEYVLPVSPDNTDNLRHLILKNKHGRMEFGAHMGAKQYAPRGSYAAYRVAGEMGFDWAWIAQIKHSSDGTMWVCHDDTLNSITDYTGTKTISEMTDTEILACKCNFEGFGYSLSDFPDSELHIPTLEEVVKLCVKYGMKMYFRADDLPTEYVEGNRLDVFAKMIKAYGIKTNEAAYSIYSNPARLNALRECLGNDIEISLFFTTATPAQDYIDWLNTNNVINRSVIMTTGYTTENDVKLLHTNNVKVYLYDAGSYEMPREDVIKCAEWGVDAIQSGLWYYLPY